MYTKYSGNGGYLSVTETTLASTYKTTRYDLALFFICIRTNVGYSVVGEFITQAETAEHISEALQQLRSWNPTWNPRFFMTDYSEAELLAVLSWCANIPVRLSPRTSMGAMDKQPQTWSQ